MQNARPESRFEKWVTKVEMLEREIAEAGKLNAVAESALSEYRAGKTRPL